MKKRSLLKNQSVKRKKKGGRIPLLGVFFRLGSGLLKIVFFLIFIALVSVSFLFFYNYFVQSPYMKLERIKAEGVDHKIRKEIILLSGLTSDMGLLSLNLEEVRKKMEQHPWVRSVKLERRFPHTLIVYAEKEVPCALLVSEGIYYVNRWGEVFKEVSGADEMDFPVITGLSKRGPERQNQLRGALQVMQVLDNQESQWSLEALSEIHIGPDNMVSLYFNHLGAVVRLAWCELDRKMTELKKVAAHLTQTGRLDEVTRIDLNYENGAVVSFKEG